MQVTLTYIGLRIEQGFGNQKIHHAFLDHKGRQVFFQTARHFVFVLGGLYLAEAKRGDKLTMKNPPHYTGHLDESKIKQAWKDADTAAHESIRQRRERAKAKRLALAFWSELAPLHSRCKRLNFFEQQAFASAVARMIVRGK